MTFFLNSHLGLSRLLRSNENRPLNFEAATSKFGNHFWNFGSSPQNGKVDLCMKNGSKALIYLTLIYFLLHFCLVKEPLWSIINYLLMHFLFFQVHQQSQNNVNSTTLIAIISKSSIPDQSLTIFWSKITRVLMVLPFAIHRCRAHNEPTLEIPFGNSSEKTRPVLTARIIKFR